MGPRVQFLVLFLRRKLPSVVILRLNLFKNIRRKVLGNLEIMTNISVVSLDLDFEEPTIFYISAILYHSRMVQETCP